MQGRGVVRLTLALIVTVAVAFPFMSANADGPSGYLRDTMRLKSGGLSSQVAPEPLEGSPFSPSSPPEAAPPFQWARNVNAVVNPFEQDEPTIAVNPQDPANILVGNHERQGLSPNAILCSFAASFDGGATYAKFGTTPLQGPVFPAAGGHSCSDSVLAADHHGDFYFAYLDLFRFTSPLRVDVLVAKSTDGGQSFSTFVPVALGAGAGAGAEDPDKEWVGVDRSAQSPFRGDVYVTYTDFSTFTIKFRKSEDGGSTFAPAPTSFGTVVSDLGFQTVSAPYPCGPHSCLDVATRYMQGSNIAVGPKGEIHVFYGDFTEMETFDLSAGGAFVNAQMTAARIMAAKSADGGLTWSRSAVRDMCAPAPCRAAGTDAHETKNTPVFRVGTIPFGGAGPDGNYVYAVWAEWDSVTFSFDPATNRDFAVSGGKIMFARSRDGGATWERAIRVDDDVSSNDKYQPAMVVQPQGVVHVVWVDRRLDPDGVDYDVFYATSTNNGMSFKPNVRVSTASSNPRGTRFVGDYIDVDGARSPFQIHAVWTDRRTVEPSAGSVGNDVVTARRLVTPP